MASEFTFYDYIDGDNGGANLINNWLNGEGSEAKAHFNAIIRNLENSHPAGFQDSVWTLPYVFFLRGPWKGFFEIRKKVKGVQYRLIGRLVERDAFLITWGFHKGDWIPDITLKTSDERVRQMINTPWQYRRQHDDS